MPVIFHTADVHLDAPFAFLGRNGQRQRQQVQNTFRAFVDRAIDDRCDLILIAGDLFDSNSPSQKTIDFAVAQFRRLAIPVCILPGTHDCFDERSVYRKTNFAQLCPNVSVFTDGQGESKEFAHLGLTVHARANLSNQSTVSPLDGLKPSARLPGNIAMANGSVVIPGRVAAPDFPIHLPQIAGCGMDYVALGHWHAFANYSQGSVPAFYAGSPEAIGFDGPGAGFFVRVLWEEDGPTQVQGEMIGCRRLANLAIAMDGKESSEEVKPLILAKRDAELALTVTLTGLKEVGLAFDVDGLVEEMAGEFFHLRIVDQSHAKLATLPASSFAENTVVGQFVRILQTRIADAPSSEEARLVEDALQLGLALLQGKEVLG